MQQRFGHPMGDGAGHAEPDVTRPQVLVVMPGHDAARPPADTWAAIPRANLVPSRRFQP